MILSGFHLILYTFHLILYGFHLILYGFYPPPRLRVGGGGARNEVGPWSMVDFGARLGGGLGILRGRDPVGPGLVACVFKHHFFDIVLGPSFFGFWCQLGPNLPPNLGTKSIQKSFQEGSKSQANLHHILNAFFTDFGNPLDRFLVGFGSPFGSQVDQTIDHRASCWQVGRNSKIDKKRLFFEYLLAPRPPNFEAKLTKSVSRPIKIQSKNW